MEGQRERWRDKERKRGGWERKRESESESQRESQLIDELLIEYFPGEAH